MRGYRRFHLGRVRIDLGRHPSWWRQVSAEYTQETDHEGRWDALHSLVLSLWHVQLVVMW